MGLQRERRRFDTSATNTHGRTVIERIRLIIDESSRLRIVLHLQAVSINTLRDISLSGQFDFVGTHCADCGDRSGDIAVTVSEPRYTIDGLEAKP